MSAWSPSQRPRSTRTPRFPGFPGILRSGLSEPDHPLSLPPVDESLLSLRLRQRAGLALAVLFLIRCLWLPAHLAFEHHQSPAASGAAAFGFAHALDHGHDHGHGHGPGHLHGHDSDRENPSCPDLPHPHAAADHQPDMRAPRMLQGTLQGALLGVPLAIQPAPVESLLPEPESRRAANGQTQEFVFGRSPPARPPVRAPPIA